MCGVEQLVRVYRRGNLIVGQVVSTLFFLAKNEIDNDIIMIFQKALTSSGFLGNNNYGVHKINKQMLYGKERVFKNVCYGFCPQYY